MSYAVSIAQRNISHQKSQGAVWSSKESQSNKMIIYLLALLVVFFSILYIAQANSVATGGYKIQKYDAELMVLQSENNRLNLELTEIQSLKFLEERVENLNMVKISQIEYVSPVSQVAAR